jgi:epoxyqueuosine reductase
LFWFFGGSITRDDVANDERGCSGGAARLRRVDEDAQRVGEIVRRLAREHGFVRVGFTPVGEFERHRVYQDWVARGFAGEMEYLELDVEQRRDPRELLANARTVVTVALSYAHPDGPDVPADAIGPRGRIARYARGADYHVVLKRKLQALAKTLEEELGRPLAALPCVDTRPILEREAAQASGVGFIAKNTMLIAPGAGSQLLLGELLLDVDCEPVQQIEPRCGECRRCLDACPTGAFVDAYTLDARRCISYLTIELTGSIPVELRPLVGDNVFGCDICQDVCPFNASARDGAPELAPLPGHSRPSLRRMLAMTSTDYRRLVKRTAMRRVHRPQLQRNAAVALGNVGTREDLPFLQEALKSKYEIVREHAAWAIEQIERR